MIIIFNNHSDNLFAAWRPAPACTLPRPGVLDLVSTITEVSRMWGKARKSIEIAILNGRLSARQAGSTWLINLASVRALWGDPRKPADRLYTIKKIAA